MTSTRNLLPAHGFTPPPQAVDASTHAEPPALAIVHWAFSPVVGGVETHLAEYVDSLTQAGHRVAVFTGTKQPRKSNSSNIEYLYHEILDLQSYPGRLDRVNEAQNTRELIDWFGDELVKRDIRTVHGHNLNCFTPAPAMALNELKSDLQLSLHHTYHSVWPDNRNIAAACADWQGQYVLSNYVREYCRKHLGVTPILTRPGIAVDRFPGRIKVRQKDGEFIILHPARMVEEKGADIIVRLLKRLRAARLPARLILTDTSNIIDWDRRHAAYREKIGELISRLNLSAHIEFREASFSEMPSLYATCDVVVYPSRYAEPLGLVPLEAAAAARPVIVTNLGGLPETVIDGETGYIVPAEDSDAFFDALRVIWDDEDGTSKMARAARTRVESNFNLTNYLRNMIDLYRGTADLV